jgi:DNA-binding YbaB/EbfC family protein
MFDMFRGMGKMADLMRNLPKIQEQVAQMQENLGKLVVEGDAGAGMVKVRCNGRMEIIGVTCTDEALKDRELLEDLVKGAVNQALAKAKQAVSAETSKMAGELGLPPGMNLPGLS